MRSWFGRLGHGASLILATTLIGFALMDYFGPDQTYALLSRNPTPEEIANVRAQLGYDLSFIERYLDDLRRLFSGDFGHSQTSGEEVSAVLARTIPTSLMLVLPGFLIGHLLAWIGGAAAAWSAGRWPDRLINGLAVATMSVSLVVLMILAQLALATDWGIKLFPARGWDASSLGEYLRYAALPTLVLLVSTAAFNTRFYRALFTAELGQPHVFQLRAHGLPPPLIARVVACHTLPAVITRIAYSLPLILIGGSLLLESYFGIPGVGKVVHDAALNGDQPVLRTVVGLSAMLFVVLHVAVDAVHHWLDPRLLDARHAG